MGENEKGGVPMQIKLELDPNMIEKHLVEAIVRSSMGKHIEKAVNAFIEKQEPRYGGEKLPSPLETAVDSLMREEIQKIILKMIKEKENHLEQQVRKLMTDEVVGKFMGVVWDKLLDKIQGY